ncbi:probable rRNA-processing protein EBP2 [Tanacetum coccineum]
MADDDEEYEEGNCLLELCLGILMGLVILILITLTRYLFYLDICSCLRLLDLDIFYDQAIGEKLTSLPYYKKRLIIFFVLFKGDHIVTKRKVWLLTMGIPFLPLTDYFAEMVKTDTHIEKIKGRLLSKKRRIEEAEEQRKARDNKKKAKEVQAHKQKERSDKAKKNKRDGVSPWDRSSGKAKPSARKDQKGGAGKRKSQEYRDTKNEFGGKKCLNKHNTAETTDDSIGFNKGDSVQNKKRNK